MNNINIRTIGLLTIAYASACLANSDIADMRRVFSNAKTYNPEGHPVWKAADTLSQFFEQKWAKAIALIHGEEEEEVMDDDDEDKGDIMDASVESGSQVGGEVITLSDDEDDEGEQEDQEEEEEEEEEEDVLEEALFLTSFLAEELVEDRMTRGVIAESTGTTC